jgi:ABC-type amino acid transport system permease subunit
MTGLSSLWLPILLSAVFVFVGSSLLHMLSPWHKSDYKTLPNEDKAMDALRALAIPPGDYMVPRPSSREGMGSPAFAEKLKKGPVMVLTVMPNGPMAMGRIMGFWFVYCLAMSVLAAYVTGRALPPGTPYLSVFRFAGATAFIGYSGALWQMAIWYRRSLSTTVKSTIDGLIYGLLTAGAFGWLWPR